MAMPEAEDGTHYELSEGELITFPSPGTRHGFILINVGAVLRATVDRKRYAVVGGDTGFRLGHATVRGADVAVMSTESGGQDLPVGYSSDGPVLAVEVVSPSNTAADLDLKVSQYLAAGSREVWLIYPDTRRVHVYINGRRDVKIFQQNEHFTSTLGCDFEVAKFFEN
jgi:Uma2 family endonuclease